MGTRSGECLQRLTPVSHFPYQASHIKGCLAYNIGRKLKSIDFNHELIGDFSYSKHIRHSILRCWSLYLQSLHINLYNTEASTMYNQYLKIMYKINGVFISG